MTSMQNRLGYPNQETQEFLKTLPVQPRTWVSTGRMNEHAVALIRLSALVFSTTDQQFQMVLNEPGINPRDFVRTVLDGQCTLSQYIHDNERDANYEASEKDTYTFNIISLDRIKKEVRIAMLNDCGSDHHRAATVGLMNAQTDRSLVFKTVDRENVQVQFTYVTERVDSEAYLKFVAYGMLEIMHMRGMDNFPEEYKEALANCVAHGATPEVLDVFNQLTDDAFRAMDAGKIDRMLDKLLDYTLDNTSNLEEVISRQKVEITAVHKKWVAMMEGLKKTQEELFLAQFNAEEQVFTELIDYIKKYKRSTLVNINRNEDKIYITLKGNMTMERAALEMMAQSTLTNPFKRLDNYTQLFLLDVAKGLYEVPVVATIWINPRNKSFRAKQNAFRDDYFAYDAVINRHWNRHACVGTLKTPLMDTLKNRQWISMYELLLTAVGQINVRDNTVFRGMCTAFDKTDFKAIRATLKSTGEVRPIRDWIEEYKTEAEVPF